MGIKTAVCLHGFVVPKGSNDGCILQKETGT